MDQLHLFKGVNSKSSRMQVTAEAAESFPLRQNEVKISQNLQNESSINQQEMIAVSERRIEKSGAVESSSTMNTHSKSRHVDLSSVWKRSFEGCSNDRRVNAPNSKKRCRRSSPFPAGVIPFERTPPYGERAIQVPEEVEFRFRFKKYSESYSRLQLLCFNIGRTPEPLHDGGFCIFCETFHGHIKEHLARAHGNNQSYFPALYEHSKVLIPLGTYRNEVRKCQQCRGLLYLNRLEDHKCVKPRQPRFYQNEMGQTFCLMCQLRCDDIKEHWNTVHWSNDQYTIRTVNSVRTLLPSGTDATLDLTFNSCDCGSCPPFSYSNRALKCRRFANKHFQYLLAEHQH